MDKHRSPFVKLSWLLIILLVFGIAAIQTMPEKVENGDSEDPVGLLMTQIQGEYLLGVASLLGAKNEIASQAIILDAGSVSQRQRYMAFMIALGEPELAKQSALKMRVEIADYDIEMTEQQTKIQEELDLLADGVIASDTDYSLEESLGWFGKLVVANETEKDMMESEAGTKVLTVVVVVSLVTVAAIAGFIGVIILLVRALGGYLRSGLVDSEKHHGIYAEVFVVWLILFTILMIVAGVLGNLIAGNNTFVSMLFLLGAFLSSLSALAWARVRGVGWSQIRKDIGWVKGKGVLTECAWGVAGYAMMLPILAVGILLVLLFILIQSVLLGDSASNPFAGTGGPSHPMVLDIASGGWSVRILLVVLAAVVAPIVEETMFRGVLYRQLRTSSNKLILPLSIIGSILLTSFIFAAIHPQGWVAIPALMAIAIGMNIMREWRGTLIPSIIVHGVSNGLVISLMLVFLS
ncbi:MAG: type II CAAX endopeptidase family protein [Phycisphaerales bacterium]|jgi:membrane protease YdiL (CAAX protease family)|nr:type II CAAX endopeptidase family protein [Phycisphaerales bacterium]